ncbi:MAG: hemolysin family protein [Candidatus Tantalella remota]|nr:hemolysin family protein [Candidatus Tantalella remota]
MITLYTILVFSAIAVLAFFTASEMALTSVNRVKLKGQADSGDEEAKKLSAFLGDEGLYLGTTLVGTNIAVVMSSVLATRIFAEYFESSISTLCATLVMVPATLIFAEIVPKLIARQYSNVVALKVVDPLKAFQRVFLPVIVSVNAVARVILSPFRKENGTWDSTFTKRDLKKILIMGHDHGEVEADEVELIHRVLDFGAKKVESIMVPFYKVSSISMDDTVGNLKRLASLTGFSRIPVYKGNKNNIPGIVNIYDILFSTQEEGEEQGLGGFLREPVHVDRGDGLDIALARLRHRKQPMGIVTEEDGKVVGIVTIEDILEEIVGEIEDTGAAI